MSLNGRIAVVTGGGKGIGRACCVRLAKDGAAIAVWDWDQGGAQETAKLIAAQGGKSIVCHVDVSSAEGVAAAAQLTRGQLGPITILINNAGIAEFTPFLDLTEEMWDRTIRINLKGQFLCAKAAVPDMIASGWGRIVNISSSSTQLGAPKMAHYVSSKSGVNGLTKALALEFARNGITVNTIPPSFIDTPMLRGSPSKIDIISATSPLGHPGKPEDIAAACSFLVSEEAGYVTGQTIGVNGGRYLT